LNAYLAKIFILKNKLVYIRKSHTHTYIYDQNKVNYYQLLNNIHYKKDKNKNKVTNSRTDRPN